MIFYEHTFKYSFEMIAYFGTLACNCHFSLHLSVRNYFVLQNADNENPEQEFEPCNQYILVLCETYKNIKAVQSRSKYS